jgi:hypothetical protein
MKILRIVIGRSCRVYAGTGLTCQTKLDHSLEVLVGIDKVGGVEADNTVCIL